MTLNGVTNGRRHALSLR